jgi:hypothetical protein
MGERAFVKEVNDGQIKYIKGIPQMPETLEEKKLLVEKNGSNTASSSQPPNKIEGNPSLKSTAKQFIARTINNFQVSRKT